MNSTSCIDSCNNSPWRRGAANIGMIGVDVQQKALNRKLRGHYQYFGRSTNFRRLLEFYDRVRRIWHKWLNRRTRGNHLSWLAYLRLLRRHPLLRPRLSRPWNPEPVLVSST